MTQRICKNARKMRKIRSVLSREQEEEKNPLVPLINESDWRVSAKPWSYSEIQSKFSHWKEVYLIKLGPHQP